MKNSEYDIKGGSHKNLVEHNFEKHFLNFVFRKPLKDFRCRVAKLSSAGNTVMLD